jgi:hypothetical protein
MQDNGRGSAGDTLGQVGVGIFGCLVGLVTWVLPILIAVWILQFMGCLG